MDRYPLRVVPGYYASRPGIQLGTQLPPDCSEEDMQFAQQLGVEWVATWLRTREENTLENYIALRKKFEAHGLKVWKILNYRALNIPEIVLNLPGRDERIAEYLDYIRALGKAGIHYATYAHQASGVWRSDPEPVRGGAMHHALRLDRNPAGHWITKMQGELTHGRVYTEEEMWDNFAYFIRKVVPVAEEAGVYIGLHPDDPPLYPLGGVPRCVLGSFAGLKRAFALADSPNIGLLLCVGTWLEGGPAMGADVLEAIHTFGRQNKIFHVHFRNVSAPLPEGFVETFPDEGYMDMYQVMRALREVHFDGVIVSDHMPQMIGGWRAAEAFAVGYMKGLAQAANDEVRE